MDTSKDDLTREIEQLAQAIGWKAELLEDKVTARLDQVKGAIEKTGNSVTVLAKAVVPTLIIRSHPWIATGSALVGGFWLARKMVLEHREQRRQREERPVNAAPTATQLPNSGNTNAGFLERHSGEVRLVRNLVLSALTRYAGKKLRTKLPQFSGQIQLAEQAVSTLLR